MMASKLIEIWRMAALDLGLEIVAPFRLDFSDGTGVDVDLLVKNFSGPKGTLVLDDYSKIAEHAQSIVDAGYGYSVLHRYSDSDVYDPEWTKEVLAEWTWTGPTETRPKWLNDANIEDQE